MQNTKIIYPTCWYFDVVYLGIYTRCLKNNVPDFIRYFSEGFVARIDRGLVDERLWIRVQDIFARDVLVPHPILENKLMILSVDNRAVFPEIIEE